MDKKVHFGEDYDEVFDHELYVKRALTCPLFRNGQDFCFSWLNEILRDGKIRGKRILEFGTGPTVYNLAFVAPYFDEIFASDFARRNRDFIHAWWDGDLSDKMLPMIKEVAEMEASGVTAKEREKEIKRKIVSILPSNILHDNPLHPCWFKTFDAVIMKWVFDSAVKNEEEYSTALCNIATLLPKGGHIIAMCILSTHWSINGFTFRGCSLELETAKKVWEDSQFQIINWKDDAIYKEKSDRTIHVFNVHGRKM